MLNRLREGKHTEKDIVNLKQRMIEVNSNNYPLDAPHLFTENDKVNKFNDRVHRSISGTKYAIKVHDSVIGATCTSSELRDKIMKQIPNLEPKNTKQLHSNLNLAVGERTEISLNTRIGDGMTNGASNIIKLIITSYARQTIWCQKPDMIIENSMPKALSLLGHLSNQLLQCLQLVKIELFKL